MAFNELEKDQLKFRMASLIEKIRPPEEIRNKLDIKFKIETNNVYIIEEREDWQDINKKMDFEIAKIAYIKKSNKWKIYWMKSDLKWHGYEPNLYVDKIDDAISIIKKDELSCFWG